MGNEDIQYKLFEENFNPKKTTDDCYTPNEIYQVVKEYVNEFVCPLENLKVERPFKLDGDYQKETEHYDENTIVIDNPPFSILAEIKRFYVRRGIKFFLFAPHTSLLSTFIPECNYIITNSRITYENGLTLNTSFVTNLLGDTLIKVCPILHERIKKALKLKEESPKFKYCDNLITSTGLGELASKGEAFELKKDEAIYVWRLDSQKPYNKQIFGSGYIITDNKAEELAKAKLKSNEDKDVITFNLSIRERELLDYVSKNSKQKDKRSLSRATKR